MLTERFQILSLDGGGFRGMFSAAVLARLEEDLGTRIVDHFDLIAGTSTGGIIALGLGLGLSPKEILGFYTEHGPRIFRDRSRMRVLRHVMRAKYGSEPLRTALAEVFGDRTFGESTKRLVIPSYNIAADDVYLFRTPHLSTLKRDWRESAVNVALATSAAPTYLPGMHLDGARLVDGGVWANNPTMVALTEAVGPLNIPLEKIRVFSLGTTTDVRTRHRRLDKGGLLPWAGDAVEVLMRAQSESAAKQVRHFVGKDNVLRLNPTVPTRALALDKVDIDTLYGLAGHVSRDASPSVHRTFCDHLAPTFNPHYPVRED
ncbi:CBASS cGAMP-activated phospholipase [Streptosporangium lutulentum]|uniref:Patatin-like phospholipase/acyl hydrolase n=1 Tax=Streptosporangium lutulentum TaxID=1461250 RepID=A0ABT9QMV8_9ACTN|nr:CBASS cGAMP-activated phospholipase [Streptosporangium lutulentum]MDP9848097.1 patatin-like phospholipase/acyl hydrolase [Streptosporangium lutulentum]